MRLMQRIELGWCDTKQMAQFRLGGQRKPLKGETRK